ncbi:MAG: ABC transporter ATP-binding protein [Acidimicrobiia bacterium]
MIVATHQLVKTYGTTTALAGVDLHVERGSVYGMVGRNGAGKTTLLGILSGLRRPTSGSIEIEIPKDERATLPDTPQFDRWLTAREVVDLARTMVDPTVDASRVDEVLEQAGLAETARQRVGGYSRGMLQRLGIAATVVARPKLLLLDEPSSALDPAGRREVLDLVERMRGEATVVFSSHILSDVQEVCDTVGILDHGTLRFEGTLDELLSGHAAPAYKVRLRPPFDRALAALGAQAWVQRVDDAGDGTLEVFVTTLENAERHLPAVLAGAEARVVSIAPEATTLEQVFLEVTK